MCVSFFNAASTIMFHTWDTICIISNGDPHIARIYSLVFSAIIVRETENLICRYWIFTFCAFLCRHGVKQQLNCWADGVPMITHCPIGQTTTLPSGSTSMHGSSELFTLWWHAHVAFPRNHTWRLHHPAKDMGLGTIFDKFVCTVNKFVSWSAAVI